MSIRHYLPSHFLAKIRNMFLGGGGHLELLRRGFKTWKISDFNVPEKLKERGVDDPNEVCLKKKTFFFYLRAMSRKKFRTTDVKSDELILRKYSFINDSRFPLRRECRASFPN